jgi:hypothetical protein
VLDGIGADGNVRGSSEVTGGGAVSCGATRNLCSCDLCNVDGRGAIGEDSGGNEDRNEDREDRGGRGIWLREGKLYSRASGGFIIGNPFVPLSEALTKLVCSRLA